MCSKNEITKKGSGKNAITKHHRIPQCYGGGDNPENISMIKHKFHQAWHVLFGVKSPQHIAKIINKLYIPSDVMFVVVPRVEKIKDPNQTNLFQDGK